MTKELNQRPLKFAQSFISLFFPGAVQIKAIITDDKITTIITGLAPSPNCECGASEQTADHVLTMCPIHRAPHGARGLTVLDDETRCWLNNITASI